MTETVDTIAAIATPPGKGGVAIVRMSGPLCVTIAKKLCGCVPEIQKAQFAPR